jgi:ribosomal protein S18 acetylase RimI-like enzyme
VIRPATPDDAEAIHELIVALATYEREPDAVQVTPAMLRAQLDAERPPFECLIAEADGGRAAGFALFFHTYSTWEGRPGLYLEDLYVREEQRGSGIGKALLLACARIAAERGCARFELAALDWNTPAIGFYESLGGRRHEGWGLFRWDREALEQLAARAA